MKLLLDTHTFLWFVLGLPDLSEHARHLIENPENEKWLSAVTPWEIAIKVSIGKMTMVADFDRIFPAEIDDNGFLLLPVLPHHASRVVQLPFHHRDPFDRMMIAQALADDMTVVGTDATFDKYGVKREW